MSDEYLQQQLSIARPVWEHQRIMLLSQQPVLQPAEVVSPFMPPEPLGQARHTERRGELRSEVAGAAAGWLVWPGYAVATGAAVWVAGCACYAAR